MELVLLSIHVLAGIVFVGGSAVAASLFPRYAPVAVAADAAPSPEPIRAERSPAVAAALHRITRGYAIPALIVPAVGIVLAAVQGRMGEIWISAAMILTAVAGALLVQIAPMQREALDHPDDGGRLRTLTMLAGIYNLLWAVVVVLMIVRPGAH
ncbi:hypothetical protein [Nocardia mexicana]|uniref:Uncharacterized protein n=1 Tax=Nocardia mexicana TaxID=279262 RepID=A0A370GRQ7_9NOCA|nr:hypothetical protein [Nocardia mexicana]RDI46392.1 hypothetical protein DFR68_111151 [Nocardia mexicana]